MILVVVVGVIIIIFYKRILLLTNTFFNFICIVGWEIVVVGAALFDRVQTAVCCPLVGFIEREVSTLRITFALTEAVCKAVLLRVGIAYPAPGAMPVMNILILT